VRRRYSAGLRAEAVAYLVEQTQVGTSAKAVASELGVSDWSLFLWSRAQKGARLKPVEVLEARPRSAVTLVTPDGYRIEGVEGRDIRAVLEALR
jgi:transposase-like protein